jgi:rod shape-determining protein MreC
MKIRKKNPLTIFLAVFIILIFFHYTGLTKPLENFLLFLVKPLSGHFYNLSSSANRAYNASQNQEDLNYKIKTLEEEVASLTVAKAGCQEALDENKKLEEMLNFTNENKFKLVVAGVIAKENIDKDNRDLVINRGLQDGLKTGLAVIDEQGILVGKVVEAKDSMARICLSVNPDCEFAASIQNQVKTQGLVGGVLGLTIKMSYIPQLEKLAVGDTVVTSGLGGLVPRGLVVGQISSIKSEDNEVWQEATINPPVNFNNLTVVSVVIP